MQIKGLGNIAQPFFFNFKSLIMATFKLGAIITDIAGSVGGTTFRRGSNFKSMYNKQGRQIKSAFSKNSVKNKIAQIFSYWSSLTEEERTFYNEQALLYPVTDKFGQEKYLTGRQFYTKLSTQLIPTNTIIDIAVFDKYVPTYEITSIVSNWAGPTVDIYFSEVFTGWWLLISVYPLNRASNGKPTKKVFRLFADNPIGAGPLDIGELMFAKFPYARIGDKFGINFQTMNPSGFQTPVQTITFTLE